VADVGIVVAGRATAAMDDGRVSEMKPGGIFNVTTVLLKNMQNYRF